MQKRRPMYFFDWVEATALLLVGLFLGMAIGLQLQLSAFWFWATTPVLIVLFGGVLLLDRFLDKISEKIFPTGIRPAKNPKPKGPRPLPKLLSFPVGLSLGLLLAWLGYAKFVLSLLP